MKSFIYTISKRRFWLKIFDELVYPWLLDIGYGKYYHKKKFI